MKKAIIILSIVVALLIVCVAIATINYFKVCPIFKFAEGEIVGCEYYNHWDMDTTLLIVESRKHYNGMNRYTMTDGNKIFESDLIKVKQRDINKKVVKELRDINKGYTYIDTIVMVDTFRVNYDYETYTYCTDTLRIGMNKIRISDNCSVEKHDNSFKMPLWVWIVITFFATTVFWFIVVKIQIWRYNER